MIEAFKLATVDRYTYVGDPKVTGAPIAALVNSTFAKERASLVDHNSAKYPDAGNPWPYYDTPEPENFLKPAGVSFDQGTTHINAVDSQGMAVSLTQSNVGFSGVVIGAIGAVSYTHLTLPTNREV